MTAKRSIDLFYDVVSPYAWVAFEVLGRYTASGKWNADLILKPFFLGGVFKDTGNNGPLMNPSKGKHFFKDVIRLGNHFKIPFKIPKTGSSAIVGKSLPAMRLLTAINTSHPELVEDLSRQLWLSLWSRSEDILQPEKLLMAAKAAGLNDAVIQDAAQRMRDDAVKNKLRETTEEALEYGAFGAPTMIVDDGEKKHLVFGSDRFHIIADLLDEKYEGPLNDLSKI